jgi:BirA family biotin operon repressor/biotin-[acetyl-CoA-carboxylase] ligase
MRCNPLDAAGVRALLRPETAARLRDGQCVDSTDSTNTQLLARGAPPAGCFDFLTAEYQHAGRGRRGRAWLAPPGGAICLSWSWRFTTPPAQLGALSLVVGVAVLRALSSCGVYGVHLKWPNDLVVLAQDARRLQDKLGGILVEARIASDHTHVVAGLGLNVRLDSALREQVIALGHRPAELAQLKQPPPERDALVAAILDQQIAAMPVFEQYGLSPFLAEFAAADALFGQQVSLQGAGAAVDAGIARGVTADGALQVERDGQIHRIIAGEVSVRSAVD